MKVLLIGLFGVAGVLSRYYLGQLNKFHFASNTIIVNIIGCFIIGLCYKHLSSLDNSKVIASAIAIGFCGGLTTFSSFILDSFKFIENNQFLNFSFYLIISITLGLLSLFLAVKINQ